jgi:hypothetical protein
MAETYIASPPNRLRNKICSLLIAEFFSDQEEPSSICGDDESARTSKDSSFDESH